MSAPRTALITGVSGQDGVYLARALLADGYRVVGTRRPGDGGADDAAAYLRGVEVVPLDLRDAAGIRKVVDEAAPDEVYNLAALSSVALSWREPELTFAVNATAVEHLLAAVRALRDRTGTDVRLLQASSAEVRGPGASSPYARSKAAAEQMVAAAREQGVFAACAVLYNHESPLRGPQFVTRKITRAAAEIALGRRADVTLGNLDVRRDWGFAGDYVGALRALLRHDSPLDVPIGTGVAHSLGDLVTGAFEAAGVADPMWHVVHDPELVRPVDSAVLVADPEPASRALGWRASVTFEALVRRMVAVDLARLRTGVEHDPGYLTEILER